MRTAILALIEELEQDTLVSMYESIHNQSMAKRLRELVGEEKDAPKSQIAEIIEKRVKTPPIWLHACAGVVVRMPRSVARCGNCGAKPPDGEELS